MDIECYIVVAHKVAVGMIAEAVDIALAADKLDTIRAVELLHTLLEYLSWFL